MFHVVPMFFSSSWTFVGRRRRCDDERGHNSDLDDDADHLDASDDDDDDDVLALAEKTMAAAASHRRRRRQQRRSSSRRRSSSKSESSSFLGRGNASGVVNDAVVGNPNKKKNKEILRVVIGRRKKNRRQQQKHHRQRQQTKEPQPRSRSSGSSGSASDEDDVSSTYNEETEFLSYTGGGDCYDDGNSFSFSSGNNDDDDDDVSNSSARWKRPKAGSRRRLRATRHAKKRGGKKLEPMPVVPFLSLHHLVGAAAAAARTKPAKSDDDGGGSSGNNDDNVEIDAVRCSNNELVLSSAETETKNAGSKWAKGSAEEDINGSVLCGPVKGGFHYDKNISISFGGTDELCQPDLSSTSAASEEEIEQLELLHRQRGGVEPHVSPSPTPVSPAQRLDATVVPFLEVRPTLRLERYPHIISSPCPYPSSFPPPSPAHLGIRFAVPSEISFSTNSPPTTKADAATTKSDPSSLEKDAPMSVSNAEVPAGTGGSVAANSAATTTDTASMTTASGAEPPARVDRGSCTDGMPPSLPVEPFSVAGTNIWDPIEPIVRGQFDIAAYDLPLSRACDELHRLLMKHLTDRRNADTRKKILSVVSDFPETCMVRYRPGLDDAEDQQGDRMPPHQQRKVDYLTDDDSLASPVTCPTETTPCYPLHYCCATGWLEGIRRTYDAIPEIIGHEDTAFGCALHYAVHHRSCDAAAVEFLLQKYPEAARKTNSQLSTPLHLACTTRCGVGGERKGGPDVDSSLESSSELSSFASSRSSSVSESALNGSISSCLLELARITRTPFFSFDASLNGNLDETVIRLLLDQFPAAAQLADLHGWTPVHLICRMHPEDENNDNGEVRLSILNALLEASPTAIRAATRRLEKPLHVAARHYYSSDRARSSSTPGTPLRILQLLLSKNTASAGIASATDSRFNAPLHWLASSRKLNGSDGGDDDDVEAVRMLVRACPDATTWRNDRELLPYDLAVRAGTTSPEILTLLKGNVEA